MEDHVCAILAMWWSACSVPVRALQSIHLSAIDASKNLIQHGSMAFVDATLDFLKWRDSASFLPLPDQKQLLLPATWQLTSTLSNWGVYPARVVVSVALPAILAHRASLDFTLILAQVSALRSAVTAEGLPWHVTTVTMPTVTAAAVIVKYRSGLRVQAVHQIQEITALQHYQGHWISLRLVNHVYSERSFWTFR